MRLRTFPRRLIVAKPEWGTKRICQSCAARFYDMQREPIVCPACGARMDVSAQQKPKRSRQAAKAVAAAPEEVEVEQEEETEAAGNDDNEDEPESSDSDDDAGTDEEDSDSAIEDVSELGDDDMTDVIDTEIEDDAER
jgi:uncharacterized protein (TIGR02300 family)